MVHSDGVKMGVLRDHGVKLVHHYAPLHYLPFIGRARALLCKPSLRNVGFSDSHFRTKSSVHDVSRGFGDYAFLTIDAQPRILRAKLAAGFPHVAIAVPAEAIETVTYSLCRFNVAMTRYLRRNGKSGFAESATNGRYYDSQQIPVARTTADQKAMLSRHLSNTMIEVLIHGDLVLPPETIVYCYAEPDARIARQVFTTIHCSWAIKLVSPPVKNPRDDGYAKAVDDFIHRALANPDWRGNGLEFDSV